MRENSRKFKRNEKELKKIKEKGERIFCIKKLKSIKEN